MLTNLSVHDFFAAMAAKGAPGGGSAAAALGVTGVSLLEMIAVLCQESVENPAELVLMQKELVTLHQELEAAINRDAEVLEEALPALMAVGPDGNSEEWNAVLLQAISVPIVIADACLAALALAKKLLGYATANVVCDTKFAAMICHTGMRGAVMMAELNLSLIREDEALREKCGQRINALEQKSKRIMNQINKVQ